MTEEVNGAGPGLVAVFQSDSDVDRRIAIFCDCNRAIKGHLEVWIGIGQATDADPALQAACVEHGVILAKLGDFMKRLHGPTKATTLGVGCVLLASVLWFLATPGTPHGREILIAAFLFVTAPVSGHLLVVAAMRVDRSARADGVGDRESR